MLYFWKCSETVPLTCWMCNSASLIWMSSFSQAWVAGGSPEARLTIFTVGRANRGWMAGGTSLYYRDLCYMTQACRASPVSTWCSGLFILLSSSGLGCLLAMWLPAEQMWKVGPSCQLCQTDRSSKRLASATLCTDWSCGWPSRKPCGSPALRLHPHWKRYVHRGSVCPLWRRKAEPTKAVAC